MKLWLIGCLRCIWSWKKVMYVCHFEFSWALVTKMVTISYTILWLGIKYNVSLLSGTIHGHLPAKKISICFLHARSWPQSLGTGMDSSWCLRGNSKCWDLFVKLSRNHGRQFKMVGIDLRPVKLFYCMTTSMKMLQDAH